REQLDVRDVIEWIARQPWSNGKVVLYGYSYSAITSLLGAALKPRHLTAVIVGHPPTDPYRDVIWQNGLFFQGFVAQWFVGQTAAQSLGAVCSRRSSTAPSRSSCSRRACCRSTVRCTRSAPSSPR